MRFSLKWILFGMAYVALAAAALTQDHWAYADLLWLATFLAICWAIVTAIFSNGSRRAAAIGFSLFASGFAICSQVAEQSIPTRRILLAAGVPEYPFLQPLPSPYAGPQPLSLSVAPPLINSYPAPATPVVPAPVQPLAPATAVPIAMFNPATFELPFVSKVRGMNAMTSMLLGLVGAWLATAAYRRQQAVAAVTPA